jgi:hypothetical protein
VCVCVGERARARERERKEERDSFCFSQWFKLTKLSNSSDHVGAAKKHRVGRGIKRHKRRKRGGE